MQVDKRSRKRHKRCLACKDLFLPDPRTKGSQRYCFKTECQNKRQRQNESDWRSRNPELVEVYREQSRQWYKSHPDYSSKRRLQNPSLLTSNQDQTRLRMRNIRKKRMFDKSKSILMEVTAHKPDKCYLTSHRTWLCVRLTKASIFTKLPFPTDNAGKSKKVSNCLPRGELYDLSP